MNIPSCLTLFIPGLIAGAMSGCDWVYIARIEVLPPGQGDSISAKDLERCQEVLIRFVKEKGDADRVSVPMGGAPAELHGRFRCRGWTVEAVSDKTAVTIEISGFINKPDMVGPLKPLL